MDGEVIRNDSSYISTNVAAELTGYSRDYVGQLARDGHFDSTKAGRKRFVDRSEFIAYALENKTGLSIDDLPENHVPNTLLAEKESDQSQTQEPEPRPDGKEVNDGDQRNSSPEDTSDDPSIVLTPTEIEPNSFQTQPKTKENRLGSRWRNERDQDRQRPKLASGKTGVGGRLQAAIITLALMAVASLGIVFGASEALQKSANQKAANIAVVAERAYEGIGYGLQENLSKQSAPGVVADSVRETAGLIAESGREFRYGLQDRLAEAMNSDQTNQTAAAATAGVVSETIGYLGESITTQFSWLTSAGSTQALARSDGNHFVNQQVQLAKTTTDSNEQITAPETEQISQSTSTSDQSTTNSRGSRKAVVVPAPTSSQAREQTKQQIREQFSDPVKISTSSTNSGVIQPQFEDRAGDKYLYIMVPAESSTTRE